MNESTFDLFEEQFWSEVKTYAKEMGVSTQYIEEEFCIDGELVRVYPEITENV